MIWGRHQDRPSQKLAGFSLGKKMKETTCFSSSCSSSSWHFALSQSQVGSIQLLPFIEHHEDAQHYKVLMAVMMMVMVVVMIVMTGSPKLENAYIWDCIEVMLDARENWG